MGTAVGGGGASRRRRRNRQAFSIASIQPKLLVWLDAGQENLADGTVIDVLHDQSGNGLNATTQSSPSRSARIKNPAIGGKAAYYCDGVSGPQMHAWASDIMSGIAASELFVVMQAKAGSTFGGVHRFSGSVWMPYDTMLHGIETFGKAASTNHLEQTITLPIALDNPVLYRAKAAANNWGCWINGKAVVAYGNDGNQAIAWLNPQQIFRNSAGDSFLGSIAEFIVTNQLLTTKEADDLTTLLLAKYGIALIP